MSQRFRIPHKIIWHGNFNSIFYFIFVDLIFKYFCNKFFRSTKRNVNSRNSSVFATSNLWTNLTTIIHVYPLFSQSFFSWNANRLRGPITCSLWGLLLSLCLSARPVISKRDDCAAQAQECHISVGTLNSEIINLHIENFLSKSFIMCIHI